MTFSLQVAYNWGDYLLQNGTVIYLRIKYNSNKTLAKNSDITTNYIIDDTSFVYQVILARPWPYERVYSTASGKA